jgi:hypothetical protein
MTIDPDLKNSDDLSPLGFYRGSKGPSDELRFIPVSGVLVAVKNVL